MFCCTLEDDGQNWICISNKQVTMATVGLPNQIGLVGVLTITWHAMMNQK